ncbi:hypothetical protein F6B41_04860 [Microbacterium lushaniae]|nr:hypothetical protein F6B41_05635 [Microbacterium lushaniae]KAA9157866.1 hypothetical protein F6B41_04860 [Microbacterium lushaniae]
MLARVARALAVLAVVAAAATGCVGSPEPRETTPTPLTDEQAFAAAEETYRAYVDALNEVDLSDPATFEPVYALTTGDANAEERKSLSRMHADGWTVSGRTLLEGFRGESFEYSSSTPSVTAFACLDVSEVTVVDATGVPVAGDERPDTYTLEVVLDQRDGSFAIASSNAVSEPTCG